MKRGVLIATGTLGGLGAVLAITPPQFGSSSLGTSTIGNGNTSAANASASTPATSNSAAANPTATKKATATATKKTATKKTTTKKTTKSTTKSTTGSSTSTTGTTSSPTPTPTPAKQAVSGTFTGDTVQTQFGPVQVRIVISNGKITAASAVQQPTSSFRTQQINAQAIPYLIDETLQAQSANIQGVGGASYTSYGWQQSLASALAKAGL